MSNQWFKFKQFIIYHNNAAMKVGTDGVLLGAWARLTIGNGKILDIGTGSGLIALMMAQKYHKAEITAIDIDVSAYNQAIANVSNSLWTDRIKLILSSFQDFNKKSQDKYDLILTNPPFFENSGNTSFSERKIARQKVYFSNTELLLCAKNLLKPEGHFTLILPYIQKSDFISDAKQYGLFPSRMLNIKPKPDKEFHRILIEFSFSKTTLKESELCIELYERHQYSEKYIELTKDFYLNF